MAQFHVVHIFTRQPLQLFAMLYISRCLHVLYLSASKSLVKHIHMIFARQVREIAIWPLPEESVKSMLHTFAFPQSDFPDAQLSALIVCLT
jgi:hypothetical protein